VMFWVRVAAAPWSVYLLRSGGVVLATVRRDPPPGNAHFSLWTIDGVVGHWSTLRDAKAFAEGRFKAGSSPTPGQEANRG